MAKLFNRLIIFEPRFFAAFIVFFFIFLSIGFALLTAVDNNGLASSLPALKGRISPYAKSRFFSRTLMLIMISMNKSDIFCREILVAPPRN